MKELIHLETRLLTLNPDKSTFLQGSIVDLEMENEKVRKVSHSAIAPLAVSGKCLILHFYFKREMLFNCI